jgi:2'-5' RNA ligase
VRLFVALALSTAVRERIVRATRPLHDRYPDLNWTRPASWHVTVAFLGEVDGDRGEDVLAAVGTGVDRCAGGTIGLALTAPGQFDGRVAWLGVRDEPEGAVAALGRAVQADIAEAGLPVQRRDVHPHLSLVRARGRRGRLPRGLLDDLPHVAGGWRGDALTVYRSHLGSGPVRYEPVGHVPLG